MKRLESKVSALVASLLVVALTLGGCAKPAGQSASESTASAPATQTQQATATSLKDDYYAAVNAEVLKQHESDEAGTWNWFYDLDDASLARQKALAQAAASAVSSSTAQAGSPEAKVGSLYQLSQDTRSRDERSMTVFEGLMRPVMEARSVDELLAASAQLRACYDLVGLVGVDSVATDEAPGVRTAQVTLPELFVDPSELTDAEGEADAREYFTGTMTLLLKGASVADEEATKRAASAYEFVSDLAKASDESASYHAISLVDLDASLAHADLASYVSSVLGGSPQEVSVRDEAALARLDAWLVPERLQALKDYLYTMNLWKLSGYMGTSVAEAARTAEDAYVGDGETADAQTTATKQMAGLLGWDMGALFAADVLDGQTKAAVEAMTAEIIAEFRDMVRSEDWLSDATKERAIAKLDAMSVRVGVPENIETYLSSYVPVMPSEGGCYLSNVLAIMGEKAQAKYGAHFEPVDRTRWNVMPQVMTACYYPTDNSINIPAAVLASPYYDASASEEANLGGIGAIIGHEVTHALDDLGRKYDEHGDLTDWWTSADVEAFNARAEHIVSYYDSYRTPGVRRQDGRVTLGENIADLGSIHCLSRLVERKGLDADAFFRAYANSWASTSNAFAEAIVSGMDEHAADKVRVNAVLASCDLFYQTYGVAKDDGMYLAPEARVTLW